MLDDMRVNDVQLDTSDIRQIESADEVAHFFAKLRYNVDVRTTIPLDAPVYTSSQDMKVQINHHELIATDPEDEDIRVYLFEMRSVTAKLRNDLARGFLKTTDQKVLLVLTADYENIEFVYLERSRQKSRRKGLTLKSTIRPIPLTVNRLNPDSVALRVLKRFTFTEEDSDYQWEKLRSAYMLAEWSEEYFNNRALFSDYYLTSRLADEKITPEWREDVRSIGREVFRHLTTARTKYTRQTEDAIRRGLYEPLFKQLGFTYTEQKSSASAAEQPDYLLYAPGDIEQPIAAALTYVWNRNLDDVDESREQDEDHGGTPFEIPGALVVSLLEAQVAPWVIVTNGKLWRLYSSTASNKATNYYEIDLEEAIAANDQITALKYWWLLFRQEAFTGFLDDLLKKSADYAKDLGERLKDRVFVEIFPQFAKGFIADMRAQGVTELDLDAVFSGTMTFLYRLMFVLYAESLELLPVNEANGYRQLSLYRLKDEIARAGGNVEDTAPEMLAAHYSDTSTDLYTRLKELFHVIDDGSDQMNMPTYNGGLFSVETDGGKFLDTYMIPDRYLAIGLDRLTRDIDQKTQALVFIDFKSLGVRQLGSIYEGLLEFKLKIASEALAVTREKGKEIYQPAKKVKKPLTTLARGEVYLENDKQERKATGSYYTPDYIVKYIVRHTVGPVLDRQFAACEPRLRNAQKGYRDYARLVEARRKGLNPSSQTLLPQGEKGFDRLNVPPELKKRMTEIARTFRKEPTRSESILWQAIRGQPLDGRKFRRQQPVGAFVLDFYCADERLAVEVDGKIHESQQEADRQRQEILEELGIRFVRISAEQVENDLPGALAAIHAAFLPSPLRGRGAGGEGDNPAVYWNSDEMRQLGDDCLNVRVLDPAMGSGHFLVEVVDYISNRLIDFLNGWSENPVWHFIDQTRQDILDEMERQGVSIDPDRLTRVALLKRSVLKRCVYGVDLNLMAVELAKVSLWLDAFTLGAPLSFLDHHLKHGNSLIGARVADVQDYLKAKEGEMVDMFSGSKFAGMMLATDLMRQVSYLSDNTIEQTRRSAQAYRDASDHLAPYKRVLDVYTSRWFGNAPGKKVKTDTVRLFLQDPQTEAWFSDPTAPLDNRLFAADSIADTATQAAEQKRFFHWELEFPEVFFAPSKPGGQDVQLRQDGGFDAVVGNPPYGIVFDDTIKSYLESEVGSFIRNNDVYAAFMEVAVKLATKNGLSSMIVPNTFILGPYFNKLKEFLLSHSSLRVILDFGFTQVFEDPNVFSSIYVAETTTENKEDETRVTDVVVTGQSIIYEKETRVDLHNQPLERWHPLHEASQKAMAKSTTVDELCFVKDVGFNYWTIGRGKKRGESIGSRVLYSGSRKSKGDIPYVKGSDFDRYTALDSGQQWLRADYKDLLDPDVDVFRYSPEFLQVPAKLVYRQTADRVSASIDTDQVLVDKTVHVISFRDEEQSLGLLYLLAVLNSQLTNFIYGDLAREEDRTFAQVKTFRVKQLPIRRIDFTTPAEEREQLVREITGAYDLGDTAGALSRVQAALAASQTDVVHDVLAHLAQTMIDLNKQKQAEVGRFLDWLEGRLGTPHPKSLSHKGRGTSKREGENSPSPQRSEWGEGPGVRAKTPLSPAWERGRG
ncbi:DUF559 domain-containing protein [bacterium]|nr:DUF559 domain-containing protein [bacterium]